MGEGVSVLTAENVVVAAAARELIDADAAIDIVVAGAADNLVSAVDVGT